MIGNEGDRGDTRTPLARTTKTPPLFNALIKAFKKDAVFTVKAGNTIVTITITQGRIINVIHDRTSSKAVVGLLIRTGLVTEQDVQSAELEARAMGTSLDDAIVTSGLVSEGTLESAQEMLCLEVLMDLLLRTEVDVNVEWSIDHNVREMCMLPVRFVLREAQKRSIDLPRVRKFVPSSKVLFVKTSALSGPGGSQSWSDLQLSSAERQVYCFVDGNRNVSELALSTCQSEYKVAQSLKTLVEMSLIRRLSSNEPSSARSQLPTRAIGSWAALGVTVVLILGVAFGVRLGLGLQNDTGQVKEGDAFSQVVDDASSRRLKAAARQYDLLYGEPPEAFDDLLREHLIRHEDLTVHGSN